MSFESQRSSADFRSAPTFRRLRSAGGTLASFRFVHRTLWNVAHQQRAVQVQSYGLGNPFVAEQTNKLGNRCCKCVAQTLATERGAVPLEAGHRDIACGTRNLQRLRRLMIREWGQPPRRLTCRDHSQSDKGRPIMSTKKKLPVSVEKLVPMLMAFDQDVEITVKPHRKPVPAA